MRRPPRAAPPRLPTRLLLALLPSDHRGQSIAGDLIEEWHARPGGAVRDLWYAKECLLVGARYVFVRRRLPPARAAGRRAAGAGFALPLDDLRLALRSARRTPGMSALTVLALGVGVAAPTLMFSVLIGVTRPLPVPEPDRVVHVGWRYTPTLVRIASIEILAPFLELSAGDGVHAAGAFSMAEHDVGEGEGFPDRRRAAAITPGVFAALGVTPAVGRAFRPDDGAGARARPTVILSEALRRAHFGDDADMLGRTLRVDGQPHAVVGVMPPGFAFPDDAELWVPLDPADPGAYRSAEIVARLAPDGSLPALRARVTAPTSRTSSWRARSRASARSPCAWRSARGAGGSCGSIWPKRACSPRSEGGSGSPSRPRACP